MSKSYKAQNKRRAAHKAAAAERARKAVEKREMEKKSVQLSEEERKDFTENYSKGGIIRNLIKIWRDSSPVTFMTYFPVVLSQLAFTLLWFFASILMFIGPTQGIGTSVRDFLTLFNVVMAAFGVPLILTYLHLKYNIRKKKYYFINTLLYTLPACIIYVALNLLNTVITVIFQEDRAELISTQLEFTLYILAAMLATLTITSCIAQLVLLYKRSRSEVPVTKLGLKIDKKKDKKLDD